MAMHSHVVPVPRPSDITFNMHRLVNGNELLQEQLADFRVAEQQLPQAMRTGVDVEVLATEAEASSYIHKMTAILRAQKELQYQELIERKYTVGLKPEDETELNKLTEELDTIDQPFYERLIAGLNVTLLAHKPDAKQD